MPSVEALLTLHAWFVQRVHCGRVARGWDARDQRRVGGVELGADDAVNRTCLSRELAPGHGMASFGLTLPGLLVIHRPTD